MLRDPACCFPTFLETSDLQAKVELERLWKPRRILEVDPDGLKIIQVLLKRSFQLQLCHLGGPCKFQVSGQLELSP